MSKELSPLEAYYKLDHTCCLNSSKMEYGIITDSKDNDCKSIYEMADCLDIIETALKDYELYEKILKDYGFNFANFREACFTLAQFRGSGFTNIEKKLKALEIIKATWKLSFYDEEQMITIDNCYSITFHNKEEFDLLKEVLK